MNTILWSPNASISLFCDFRSQTWRALRIRDRINNFFVASFCCRISDIHKNQTLKLCSCSLLSFVATNSSWFNHCLILEPYVGQMFSTVAWFNLNDKENFRFFFIIDGGMMKSVILHLMILIFESEIDIRKISHRHRDAIFSYRKIDNVQEKKSEFYARLAPKFLNYFLVFLFFCASMDVFRYLKAEKRIIFVRRNITNHEYNIERCKNATKQLLKIIFHFFYLQKRAKDPTNAWRSRWRRRFDSHTAENGLQDSKT